MLLSKSFLLQALPDAKFYCANVQLDHSLEMWNFYGTENEVTAAFDSRSVTKNSIFFAFKGQNFDGHNFINQALDLGAVALVVNNTNCIKNLNLENKLIILVPDTYQAMVSLAKAWRANLTCQIIGITGSIGKTSTKEILRSIMLQTNTPSYFSAKNENTFIGLCTHILNIKKSCKAAILEVGTDQPGEMEAKSNILRPTIAMITSISYSHIENFDTLQKIASEKLQLFKNLGDNGVGIIPGDLPILKNICYAHPTTTFGFKLKNKVQARKIKTVSNNSGQMYTTFTLKWYNQKKQVKFNSVHRGMLNNVLAASTIAYFLNASVEDVVNGIENYKAFENRFEPRKIKNHDGMIISDCYNANPESMKAAILAFDSINTKSKKIAVIGDMLELGAREVYWHRQIGRILCNTSSIEQIILVGELVKYTAGIIPENMILAKVNAWQEAEEPLKKYIATQDAMILVKASHGIQLDKLVKKITT